MVISTELPNVRSHPAFFIMAGMRTPTIAASKKFKVIAATMTGPMPMLL